MTEEIIALDLETTGLNPRTDQILELGAARIRNGRVEDTYAAFINIGKKIPEFIVGLTGITDEMAEGGLPLGKHWMVSLIFAEKHRSWVITFFLIIVF